MGTSSRSSFGRMRVVIVALLALFLLAPTRGGEGEAPHVGTYSRYAVAADDAVASDVGARILAQGGTAADAAAATMLALGVVNPASSGFGGGGFALYYRASDQSLHFLDFRERAPAASTPTMFDGDPIGEGPLNETSQIGGLASGIPGEPAGIAALVERFGRLELSRVVQPAIRLAERGVPVPEYRMRALAMFWPQLSRDAVAGQWFGGAEPTIGARMVQRELAATLRVFAAQGPAGIYEGEVAARIVAENNAAGGVFTLEDLADYEVVTRAPLQIRAFGHRIATAPPPSAGGFTMLQSLSILERLDPEGRASRLEGLHLLAESWKGPYLDRERYFGDPDHVEVPLERLSAAERIAARVGRIRRGQATPSDAFRDPIEPDAPVAPRETAGTSHLCVVDAEGNIAAITTTVNLPFGARYTAAGIVMNDEMDDFARSVGEANAFGLVGGERNLPGPGRRPVSSMSPTIVFDENGPVLCAGASGGSRIITATQQVILGVIRDRLGVRWSVERPRIHHQGHPEVLYTETASPLDPALIESLRAFGHTHETMRNVANVQAIELRGGRIIAVSDPRKGGRPAGR